METAGKSPVNIVQELIAIHTTRMEAYKRIKEKVDDAGFTNSLNKCIEQSDRYSKELLDELSEFGDAVAAEVDQDVAFNNVWKNALKDFDGMDPAGLRSLFDAMEESLKKTYRQYNDIGVELTVRLKESLDKQSGEIFSTGVAEES